MCWAMPHFCCPEYEIFVKWYSKGQELVEGRYVADYHQDSDNGWTMCSMSKFVIHIHEAQIHEVHCSNSYEFCSFTFLSSFQLFKDFYGICICFKMSSQKANLVLCHHVFFCICIVVSRCLLSTWCSRSRATIRPERQLFHLPKITTIIYNGSNIVHIIVVK